MAHAFAPAALLHAVATVAVVALFLSVPSTAGVERTKARVGAGPGTPTDLRVEYLREAYGIDTPSPRFSWVIAHADRNQAQSAYRIVVSTSPTLQPSDAWDSGQVASNRSAHVAYAGRPLQSDTTYYWSVTVWDASGAQSAAARSWFVTALFDRLTDWQGSWISCRNARAYYMRTEFLLPASDAVREARAFVTGLGYYELRINGKKMGDAILDPSWTTFKHRIMYSTVNVTAALRPGANAIGALLGNGWPGVKGAVPWELVQWQRIFLLQLNIHLASGRVLSVVSRPQPAGNWTCGVGAVQNNSVYDGELYDARLEASGWDMPGFDARQWAPAIPAPTVPESTIAILSARMAPAVRRIAELPAKSLRSPASGVYVFDFEQNFSGFCRLRLRGPLPAGTRIQLRHAELLMHMPYGPADGNIYVGNLRSAQATDVYITNAIADGEVAEHEPRFTYHGFRYVELTGLPAGVTPQLDWLVGIYFRSGVDVAGHVEFPTPVLNQLQRAIVWGQGSNLMSVPTDCDQRDERKGWMGDAALSAYEATYNYDMGALYSFFLRDIRDSQVDVFHPHPVGSVPDTVPYAFGSYPADPAWGTAYPTIAHRVYQHYGDRRIAEGFYDGLAEYILNQASYVQQTGLAKMYSYYGDWVPPPAQPGGDRGSAPPGSLTSAFSFISDLQRVADIADAIGHTEDAALFRAMWAEYREQFHAAFYDGPTRSYGKAGLQSAIALALTIGGMAAPVREAVIGTLIADIEQRRVHLSTGIIGTRFMFDVLTEAGHGDLALSLLLQTDYPSFGYMFNNDLEPATTLWELWDSAFQGPGMNSRNHIMFGGMGDWLYTSLLGLRQRPGDTGFTHVVVHPRITTHAALPRMHGWYRSLHGTIAVQWAQVADTASRQPMCPSTLTNGTIGTLSCVAPGAVITRINFASFGQPFGVCGNYAINPSCNAASSRQIVEELCLNVASCSVPVSESVFGAPCAGNKYLIVQYECSQSLHLNISIPANTDGEAHLPLAHLGLASTATVSEAGATVWSNGAFRPGISGVRGARVDAERNTLAITIGSGAYAFVLRA